MSNPQHTSAPNLPIVSVKRIQMERNNRLPMPTLSSEQTLIVFKPDGPSSEEELWGGDERLVSLTFPISFRRLMCMLNPCFPGISQCSIQRICNEPWISLYHWDSHSGICRIQSPRRKQPLRRQFTRVFRATQAHGHTTRLLGRVLCHRNRHRRLFAVSLFRPIILQAHHRKD